MLDNVYFVPNYGKNLISIACLLDTDYSVNFNNGIDISLDRNLICNGFMRDNLYYLKLKIPTLYDTVMNDDSQRGSKQKVMTLD